MKKLSKFESDLMDLALPIGVMIVRSSAMLDILFANDVFLAMLGFENVDELIETYHGSAWNLVHPLDMDRLKKEAVQRSGHFDAYEISYRVVKNDGGYIWVSQNSRHSVDENGEEVIFAYYTDITRIKRMEDEILAGARKYETLINSIPGGVGMYRWDESLTPIYISDRVYELCDMTEAEYAAATKNSTLDVFHPDDRQGMMDAVQHAYENNRKFDYTHRVLQKHGGYHWMRVCGQIMPSEDGSNIIYVVFTDVNEQIKAENALKESELRYATAIESSNINIWEYDYVADSLTIFARSVRVSSPSTIIKNYIRSAIGGHHVREDCIQPLLDAISQLKSGENQVTLDLWLRLSIDSDYWCERVICTNIFSDSGVPSKAYCIGRDVTKEKEAEKRYRDEMSYREAMQKATLASINVNLTQNIIIDYRSNFPQISEHMRSAKTAQEYFSCVYTELTTEDMRKKCTSVFNCEALLGHFANGETTISMELTRMMGGQKILYDIDGTYDETPRRRRHCRISLFDRCHK